MVQDFALSFTQAQSGITDLVEGVYPDSAPEGAKTPFIVMTCISHIYNKTRGGRGLGGIVRARMQFDIFADKASVANAIVDALRDNLQGRRGIYFGRQLLYIDIADEGEMSNIVEPWDGSDDWGINRSVDYYFKLRSDLTDLPEPGPFLLLESAGRFIP